jgi:hypothetical protein
MDHLNKETRTFLESCSDDSARIKYLKEDMWIGYPLAKNVLDRMEGLLNHPRNVRMQSLLVIGTTQNGKTSIMKRFLAMNQQRVNGRHQVEFPVVSIEMPPNPNEKSFLNQIMEGMCQPTIYSGKDDYIRRGVINSMKELKVRLLIVDEVQHIGANTQRKSKPFLDSIKHLSNQVSLPIVAFGTEEAQNVFQSDPQLNNRFKKVHLTKWLPDDSFRVLLKSFEMMLPLKEKSDLVNEDLAVHIYQRTDGTIGEISDVLKLSSIDAIKNKAERITKPIVDKIEFESSREIS